MKHWTGPHSLDSGAMTDGGVTREEAYLALQWALKHIGSLGSPELATQQRRCRVILSRLKQDDLERRQETAERLRQEPPVKPKLPDTFVERVIRTALRIEQGRDMSIGLTAFEAAAVRADYAKLSPLILSPFLQPDDGPKGR